VVKDVAELTETSVTFPPGRYGRRRQPRRQRPWVTAVALVMVAVVGTLIAVSLYQRYGDGRPYDATVTRFYDVTDSQVVVEFTVVVPEGETAICAVRARNSAGAEIGREEVRVVPPPGETHPLVEHRLPTSDRPVTGEVQRCWRATD
jgi:hypothetical protein